MIMQFNYYCIIVCHLNYKAYMYVLYERFLQQAKEEDINNYNIKHKDYLVRSGKIKEKTRNKPAKQGGDKAKTIQANESSHTQENQRGFNLSQNYIISDERPIKTSNKYNFEIQQENSSIHMNQVLKVQNMIKAEDFRKGSSNKIELIEDKTQEIRPKTEVLPKQRSIKPVVAINQMEEFPVDEENIVLVECPMNCGRKFNEKILEKHIKICQKVFQQKRKVFKVKVVDEEAEVLKKKQSTEVKKKEIPKWKKESLAFRNLIKADHSETKCEQVVDDRIQCKGCGRKFNQKVAQKHIESCINRNKSKK